jgi:acetyl-CoA carboxylase beta subunit
MVKMFQIVKILFMAKQLKENLNVCPKCNYYFKMSAIERIELLLDPGPFLRCFLIWKALIY